MDAVSKWLLGIAGVLGVAALVLGIYTTAMPTQPIETTPSIPSVASEPMNEPPAQDEIPVPEPEPGAPGPDNPVTECTELGFIEDCKPPEPKDPSQDPAAQGKAPIGGGLNADSGPGCFTAPEDVVLPPDAPRVNPDPSQAEDSTIWSAISDWWNSLFQSEPTETAESTPECP